MYEKLVKEHPNDEELANAWFMSLAREGNYKAQQQASIVK
jgi:hypothetical protein